MGPNNEIRLRLWGRRDKTDHDFYVGVTDLPISIDLSNTVLLFFPDEDGDEFGGDLVIKRSDKRGFKKGAKPNGTEDKQGD